jgi:RimJ/RimL family protein N-acetyltransferase
MSPNFFSKKLDIANENEVTFMYNARTNSSVSQWLNTKGPNSYEDHKNYLKNIPKNKSFYICYADNDPVGYFQITKTDELTCELGWVIHPDYQGQGYGTMSVLSAINTATLSGFKCLTLNVLKNNLKAIKLYEKYGFKKVDSNNDSYFYQCTINESQ